MLEHYVGPVILRKVFMTDSKFKVGDEVIHIKKLWVGAVAEVFYAGGGHYDYAVVASHIGFGACENEIALYPLGINTSILVSNPACECGSAKCGSPRHSHWCPMYSINEEIK